MTEHIIIVTPRMADRQNGTVRAAYRRLRRHVSMLSELSDEPNSEDVVRVLNIAFKLSSIDNQWMRQVTINRFSQEKDLMKSLDMIEAWCVPVIANTPTRKKGEKKQECLRLSTLEICRRKQSRRVRPQTRGKINLRQAA